MTTPHKARQEQANTYIVQNRSSEDEMARLRIQDEMITSAIGGTLPEQPDADLLRRVLDVGCGTGNWILAAAQAYPDMSLIGVDINRRMIDYAREQAQAQALGGRVEFAVMDALRKLEFPDHFFDLVNLRFGVSWIRTWEWPELLQEMQRITRPGGTLRITELQVVQQSNSPAFTRIQEMIQRALFESSHLFENTTDGLTVQLAPLLTRHGLQDVQAKPYTIEYPAGTPQRQAYYEGWAYAFRTFQPFLQKWGSLPQDYDTIRQQALKEMQQNEFTVATPMLTAWGRVHSAENNNLVVR